MNKAATQREKKLTEPKQPLIQADAYYGRENILAGTRLT